LSPGGKVTYLSTMRSLTTRPPGLGPYVLVNFTYKQEEPLLGSWTIEKTSDPLGNSHERVGEARRELGVPTAEGFLWGPEEALKSPGVEGKVVGLRGSKRSNFKPKAPLSHYCKVENTHRKYSY